MSFYSAIKGPIAAEQQIDRARVGGQITPEQAAGLEQGAPGPFQPDLLHPSRRAGAATRQKVEQAAGCLDDADVGEMRGEFLDERLLVWHAQRNPEIIRRQRVDLVDLRAQRFATEIA